MPDTLAAAALLVAVWASCGLAVCACCTGGMCCGYTTADTFTATLSASTVACLNAVTDTCTLTWDGVCWSCEIAIDCTSHGVTAFDLLTIVLCCGVEPDTMCGHIVLTGPASEPPNEPFVGCENCTPCDPFDLTLTCSELDARAGCCVAADISIDITPDP